MEDRRIRKTRKAIHIAFSELIQIKTIEKISVTELCIKADISKSTFYLHYKDIYDYADQVASEITEDIAAVLSSYDPTALISRLSEILNSILKVVHKQNDYYLPFLNSPYLSLYTAQRNTSLIERIVENDFQTETTPASLKMTTTFLLSGMFTLLEDSQYKELDPQALEDLEYQLQHGFRCSK